LARNAPLRLEHSPAALVETEDQRSELDGLGCDLGQGYLWARPLPFEVLSGYLADERAASVTGHEDLGKGLNAA